VAINIGDVLQWDGSITHYRVDGFTGDGRSITIVNLSNDNIHYYGVEKANRLIDSGSITVINRGKPSKIKKKKSGHEMQHCPFCMAAWLLDDASKPRPKCKYCGAGLM
jgi:hypothetical protein